MKARTLRVAVVVGLASQLGGCFFVFIPGSLIQKVSDGFTGAEGEHCVSTVAKVGDKIRTPSGATYTVRSLSGTSSRCNDPGLPIRAALDPAV